MWCFKKINTEKYKLKFNLKEYNGGILWAFY